MTPAPRRLSNADLADAAIAPLTRLAYDQDLAAFTAWCAPRGLCPLPALPATVQDWVNDLVFQGRAPRTINRRLSGVAWHHARAGVASPLSDGLTQQVRTGAQRTAALTHKASQAAALTGDLMERALAGIPAAGLGGHRDRALLAITFAGALRRQEACRLLVEDLEWLPDGGVRLYHRTSKGDRRGDGAHTSVAAGSPGRCPVALLRTWLEAAGITRGPVFRAISRDGQSARPTALSAGTVNLVVKAAGRAIGLDAGRLSGHSLRAGWVTSAYAADVPEHLIAAHARHQAVTTTRRYNRTQTTVRSLLG